MKFTTLCILVACLTTGCAANYQHHEMQHATERLDCTRAVLISIPANGWYENTQYPGSGRMTADAIRVAFSRSASEVDVTGSCHGNNCLQDIDARYGYYVKSEILHWEERATEWSGRPDRIEIGIAVYDAVTKKKLAHSSYTGRSKLASFGGDHPQELLARPTTQYVNSLYQ